MLDLRNTGVRDAGAAALGSAAAIEELRVLNLGSNNITDQGVVDFAAGTGHRSLRMLDISNNYIGDKGAEAILASRLKRLDRLILRDNPCAISARELLFRVYGPRVEVI